MRKPYHNHNDCSGIFFFSVCSDKVYKMYFLSESFETFTTLILTALSHCLLWMFQSESYVRRSYCCLLILGECHMPYKTTIIWVILTALGSLLIRHNYLSWNLNIYILLIIIDCLSELEAPTTKEHQSQKVHKNGKLHSETE